MLVGGVVHHQVGDDPDAPAVGLLEELGDVVDLAGLGQHGEEVADVVAAVAQRRLVEGQQPEAVDAEPLEVVELLREPDEVADAVAVGVVEPPDGHLVEDGGCGHSEAQGLHTRGDPVTRPACTDGMPRGQRGRAERLDQQQHAQQRRRRPPR